MVLEPPGCCSLKSIDLNSEAQSDMSAAMRFAEGLRTLSFSVSKES